MSRASDGTAYDLTGPTDAPVVALIHGLGLSRGIWAEHMSAFGDFRVLNYDLYGHGASAPSPNTASLKVYADQLVNLMDELELAKASVVGFSIGGMINRRFALDHPDRLDALVILNSPHDRGKSAQEAVEARATKVRSDGPMATLEDALKRWFTPEFLSSSVEVPDQIRNWRVQVDPESYAQVAWVLAHGVRELTGREGEITAPTLVMTSENDAGSTPQMSRDIAAEIAGAELQIVPKLQHLGLMEQPDLFAAPIAGFLRKVM